MHISETQKIIYSILGQLREPHAFQEGSEDLYRLLRTLRSSKTPDKELYRLLRTLRSDSDKDLYRLLRTLRSDSQSGIYRTLMLRASRDHWNLVPDKDVRNDYEIEETPDRMSMLNPQTHQN